VNRKATKKYMFMLAYQNFILNLSRLKPIKIGNPSIKLREKPKIKFMVSKSGLTF